MDGPSAYPLSLHQSALKNGHLQGIPLDVIEPVSSKKKHFVFLGNTQLVSKALDIVNLEVLPQPPHKGYKLTELVHNFLRGDERPKKNSPTAALLVSDGSPDFGAPRVHPGCQPPSTEGCCRDARSPGPRLPHEPPRQQQQ